MDSADHEPDLIAFEGLRRLAAGPLGEVRPLVQAALDRGAARVLVFEAGSGRAFDLPPAGGPGPTPAGRPRGRPKLGVVAREVTLLPRHWDWLNGQPGGASVTLRKLVEEARRRSSAADQVREGQDAAYRFMSAIAGDLPGFEEAIRALYRRDGPRFENETAAWPEDVREHARVLAARAF
jgi:uncharacterized protein